MLFPSLVGTVAELNNAAPSVQSRYRTFIPTMGRSDPVLRIGTLGLAGSACLAFFLCIGATGSHVPHESQDQAHAAFMPDAGRAAFGTPPTFSQERETFLVSTSFGDFRHVFSGSLALVFLILT